ncbi:MAG: PIN domain-containing protein, partial [Verrucomicrobia bacterium]|nr:PIN domain-containing protein [Verrucomicrobiota bacterium]
NALSAWIDGDPDIEKVLLQTGILKLNSVSLGEYRFGILQSRNRTEYERALSLIEADVEILLIDRTTAVLYAQVRQELKTQGTPIPYHDIWIASLAKQHDLPIVSRDTHFDQVRGIRRVSW